MPIAPPVIITDAAAVQQQLKTRAQRIEIFNPAIGNQAVRFFTEQQIIADGEPLGAAQGAPEVNRAIAAVATQTVTVTDPVTGIDTTISVAGIATAIQALFVQWFNEDRA